MPPSRALGESPRQELGLGSTDNGTKGSTSFGAASAAQSARLKLEQRGGKIEQLEVQSSALESSASSFAEMCHQLAKREQKKTGGGWFGS